LTSKPNAIVSLKESLKQGKENFQTRTAQYDAQFYISAYKSFSETVIKLIDSYIRYDHPYKTEIEQYSYPESVYTTADPIQYHPFESTTATFVDTPKALEKMLAELKGATEIAIDLEHHDTRSYVGIVCLMQISTRDRDWIVDTLKPWRRRLECLNEVFTDPKIVKVIARNRKAHFLPVQFMLNIFQTGLPWCTIRYCLVTKGLWFIYCRPV
jgi:hypothetical protein